MSQLANTLRIAMNFPPSNFPSTQPIGGEGTFSLLEHQDERREIKRPGPVHAT